MLIDERTKTLPWADDEYLILDRRWRLVYSATPERGITEVHLPGRRTVPLDTLHRDGHDVELPRRVRV